MKRVVLIIFIFILVLSGCGGSKSKPAKSASGAIKLQIANTQFTAKTIQPTIDMKIAYYNIACTGPEGSSPVQKTGVTDGAITIEALAIGTWSITIDAYNASGTNIAAGYASAAVKGGSTSEVMIEVLPLQGNGILKIGLSWPEQLIANPAINGTLFSSNGNLFANLNFTLAGDKLAATYENLQIPAGYYCLTVQLCDGSTAVWSGIEAVRILASQTSAGNYPLTVDTIDPVEGGIGIIVVPIIQNPINITFAGQQSELRQGTTMTVQATPSELVDSYKWYLNGVLLTDQTTPVITLGAGLQPRPYRLDLMVTKGSVLSSATLYFKVIPAGATLAPTATPTSVPGTTPQAGTHTLAMGASHSLAIKNGQVYAWGKNNYGQLGAGSSTATTPVPVPGLTNAIQVAAGTDHSLALLGNGTLYAWGLNDQGQIGNNTTTNVTSPQVILHDVIAIAAGTNFSLAVKQDGTVWSWGGNNYGQLGTGNTTASKEPVPVSGLTDIRAVACGQYHGIALKTDGTIWSWGNNVFGQLGDGTKNSNPQPKQVTPLSNIKAICAAATHSLAVANNGLVYGWGNNSSYPLGKLSNSAFPSPTQVPGVSNVQQIATASFHTIILKNDGSVWLWGTNNADQLGSAGALTDGTPNQLTGYNAVAISAGGQSSLIQITSGSWWAWGLNSDGQLGNGSQTNSSIPVAINL